MAIRSFFALDNETLIVTSSSNGSIVGDPIVNNSDTPNGTVFRFDGGRISEIVVDDTSGSRALLEDDQASGHIVQDGAGLVSDGARIESESEYSLRELDENGTPFGPLITINVFSQGGSFSNIWGIGLTAPLKKGASYVKVSGSNTGTSQYNDFIACFTKGTRLKCAEGGLPVEDLKPGQMVWTQAAGLQPVQWIGSTTANGLGAFAPVLFEAGVLGNTRDLMISPQHRVWISSGIAELYFGHREVLVAAKHLCGMPGVRFAPMPRVHYIHIMFDRHQIVSSNGALTESFFLAENAVSALDQDACAELAALFPSLKEGVRAFGETAAPTLTAREAAALRSYLAA